MEIILLILLIIDFIKLLPLAAYEGDDEVGFLVKAVSYEDDVDVTINSLFVIVAILGNCLFFQFPVLVQMILYLSNNKQKDE